MMIMMNHNDFRGSQADRDAQIRHAGQQHIAHEAQSEARLGPVFGPLLAKVGDGLVAAGTRLQQRYAGWREDTDEPINAPRPLVPSEQCGS